MQQVDNNKHTLQGNPKSTCVAYLIESRTYIYINHPGVTTRVPNGMTTITFHQIDNAQWCV